MKLSETIAALQAVQAEHGDIEVELQNTPPAGEPITAYGSFFIVPQLYDATETEPAGYVCNLRSWPY